GFLFYGTYISIFMDHPFHSTSSTYFTRSWTSTFSDSNKKPSTCIHQNVWSWTINNEFSFEFGYFIDPLTSIMSILITTVGILVLIYSDNYMSHDQGYLSWNVFVLLIGFWFTRPIAANACQKAFVTNRVGDFGLLLGILGLYWITGSFEFQDLFEIFNNLILNNRINLLFLTLCAFLLFVGPIAKSAQFPLHVWLPDAMEGPTPISALIHAATMVAAGIFLVARIITVLLGATLALAQKDIKRGLAYSTMSQLGYMMLALGSGSIIHSMEAIVGYSPDKSQNMILMGGLTKTCADYKNCLFSRNTLTLWYSPPCLFLFVIFAIFAIIACSTAGLTAFYMFRIYLLTFEGHLNTYFINYSGKKSSSFYSILYGGKEEDKKLNRNFGLVPLLTMNNTKRASFLAIKHIKLVIIQYYSISYAVLLLFTLFIGAIGIPFNQEGIDFDILSKLLTPSINLLHTNQKILLNLTLLNSFQKWSSKRI
ncbi:hypothetical protein HID58_090138, partial [Brassica napus]